MQLCCFVGSFSVRSESLSPSSRLLSRVSLRFSFSVASRSSEDNCFASWLARKIAWCCWVLRGFFGSLLDRSSSGFVSFSSAFLAFVGDGPSIGFRGFLAALMLRTPMENELLSCFEAALSAAESSDCLQRRFTSNWRQFGPGGR